MLTVKENLIFFGYLAPSVGAAGLKENTPNVIISIMYMITDFFTATDGAHKILSIGFSCTAIMRLYLISLNDLAVLDIKSPEKKAFTEV